MDRIARHGSLRSEVYQRLRDDILQGRYKRGSSLTEAQLTTAMGVSRTPIREAISQLMLDGLVRATPNKSVVVQGFDDKDMIDLYEVRRTMETMAAGKAAEKITSEQQLSLQSIFDRECRQTDTHSSVEELQDLDNEFHDMIFQASGSKIFRNILSSINIYTRHARLISLASPGRSQKVLTEHARILAAIQNRDAQAASQAMLDHINCAATNYMTVNDKGGKTDDH